MVGFFKTSAMQLMLLRMITSLLIWRITLFYLESIDKE